MTSNTSYAALVALILMPFLAFAQDEEIDSEEFIDPMEQSVPVADEVALPEPEPDVATEERLLQEFARYRDLVQAGTFDEADIAAKRIVEMAIQVYGAESRETANALNNLGIVQHNNGQFDAAIQNFSSGLFRKGWQEQAPGGSYRSRLPRRRIQSSTNQPS